MSDDDALPTHPPVTALSFDFADTLYPHRARELDFILERVAAYLRDHLPPFEFAAMRTRFLEIRDRQFAENRATLQENDFGQRFRETIAFLRAAAKQTDADHDPALLRGAIDAYTDAFVDAMVCPPYLPGFVADLAKRYKLCVISNYPVASPIVRTLARDGLLPYLECVIVSADIGFIKPHPSVFEAALRGSGDPPPASVVHIGDDWDADIVGAGRMGMRTVYTRQWRDAPDKRYGEGDAPAPLAEIDDLNELPALLDRLRGEVA